MDQTSELSPSGNSPELRSPLRPEEIQLRSYFRGSFRYAQGSLMAQSFITQWAYSSGRIQTMEIPEVMPEYIEGLMPPGNHIISSKSKTNIDIEAAWRDLYISSRATEFVSPQEALENVLNEILKRELKYQLVGRKGRSQTQDKYDSYLRRFVVLGEKADSPILDDLSQELEEAVAKLTEEPTPQVTPETLESREIKVLEARFKKGGLVNSDKADSTMTMMGSRKMLSLVVALWEKNHPGQQFFPAQN